MHFLHRGYMKIIKIIILVFVFFIISGCDSDTRNIRDIQEDFLDLRFGAFFHYGIRTYTGGKWGEANQDITQFNPSDLDCDQWADALVSAGMKFGILTTKHHDGFCLWDSKYSKYDVASIPWKNGKGDVLREFVDALRNKGLVPCFYYSVWDNTAGIGNDSISPGDMKVIEGQITEILSNYGKIGMLFLDGWSWKMGHKKVPYDKIRSLVKNLQPDCILIDNTHLPCLYNNDMIHFEDGSPCPPDNNVPAILSRLIYKNSGNGWFWDERVPEAELMTVKEIVDSNLLYLEPRWCNFILNLPPNPEGKLDNSIVERLKDVGKVWIPDPNRAPLPEQQPFMNSPITPFSATTTSGNADFVIDGLNDRYYYSVWESDSLFPQTITIDLGKTVNDVTILSYVPKFSPVIVPMTEGSIKKYSIFSSIDNVNFAKIKNGEWNGDSKMKVVTFPPVKARFIKIQILSANGGFAAATEIAIGQGETE